MSIFERELQGVTRSVGIEIVVRLVYRTNARRTGKRERVCGIYNPENEYAVALMAADIALSELIEEAKEDYDREAARKTAKGSKPKRKPTKKEKLLFDAQAEQAEGTEQ